MMNTRERHPASVVVIAPAEGARVRGPARSAVLPRMAKQKRKVPGVPEKKGKKFKKAAAEALVAHESTQGSEEAPEGGGASSDREPTTELTPEEKRVLERKLKKERRKEERKRLREAGTTPAQPIQAQRSGAQLALDYLCSWARKREDWRFQKTRQTWLLLHMYDSDQVPEEHFPALLAYLEGLQGQARELTLQKAEALMRELDQAGTDDPDLPLRVKTQRVRQAEPGLTAWLQGGLAVFSIKAAPADPGSSCVVCLHSLVGGSRDTACPPTATPAENTPAVCAWRQDLLLVPRGVRTLSPQES